MIWRCISWRLEQTLCPTPLLQLPAQAPILMVLINIINVINRRADAVVVIYSLLWLLWLMVVPILSMLSIVCWLFLSFLSLKSHNVIIVVMIRDGGSWGLQSDQLEAGKVQAGESWRQLAGLDHCCLLCKVIFVQVWSSIRCWYIITTVVASIMICKVIFVTRDQVSDVDKDGHQGESLNSWYIITMHYGEVAMGSWT